MCSELAVGLSVRSFSTSLRNFSIAPLIADCDVYAFEPVNVCSVVMVNVCIVVMKNFHVSSMNGHFSTMSDVGSRDYGFDESSDRSSIRDCVTRSGRSIACDLQIYYSNH